MPNSSGYEITRIVILIIIVVIIVFVVLVLVENASGITPRKGGMTPNFGNLGAKANSLTASIVGPIQSFATGALSGIGGLIGAGAGVQIGILSIIPSLCGIDTQGWSQSVSESVAHTIGGGGGWWPF